MQPEQKIFSKHDLDGIATEALNYEEWQLKIQALSEALENPDKVEGVIVGSLGNFENPIVKLDNYLHVYMKLTIEKPGNGDSDASNVELFEPYERVVSEEHFGTEFATSLISADLYEPYQKSDDPVAKLILFKLDHSASNITAKDLVIGENCVYGVLVVNDEIKPFRLTIGSREDRVIQELQRNDPTAENGMSVEARVVEKSGYDGKLYLHELDADKDAEEYLEIMAELDKFIEHRQQKNKNWQLYA